MNTETETIIKLLTDIKALLKIIVCCRVVHEQPDVVEKMLPKFGQEAEQSKPDKNRID